MRSGFPIHCQAQAGLHVSLLTEVTLKSALPLRSVSFFFLSLPGAARKKKWQHYFHTALVWEFLSQYFSVGKASHVESED